jgi:hypothetical protein
MTLLVIPAAGQSTRYGLSRPKFLLQHPLGGTMLTHAITCLGDLQSLGIDRIRIITLRDFFETISVEKLKNQLVKVTGVDVEFDLLDTPTASMVETLVTSLEKLEVDTSFIVKDCDNEVCIPSEMIPQDVNFISYVDLANFPQIVAHNKSFLTFSEGKNLSNIVEKRIVSAQINVGCVRFKSVSDFLSAAVDASSAREIFVSDVIRVLLERGHTFLGVEAGHYEDWGTLQEWREYTGTFKTIFVDLDGVLVSNENPLGVDGGWDRFIPISENVSALIREQNNKRTKFVFTTARSEEFRDSVESNLRNLGFLDFYLIMDLPHAKRVLINDFAATNVYPTAIAVNLPRNSPTLQDYI